MRRALVIVAVAVGLVGAAAGIARWPRLEARSQVLTRPLEIRSPDGIESFAYAPDGRTLVTAGKQGLRLWDPVTGNEIRMLVTGQGPMTAVAFAPDGRSVISGQQSGEVQRWDASTGAQLGAFAPAAEAVTSLVFAPDGHTLAGGTGRSTHLWDVSSGRAIRTVEHGWGQYRSPPVFSADGLRIGRATGTLALWDIMTGSMVEWPPIGLYPRVAALSPDGTVWAAGGSQDDLWLMDRVTTEQRRLIGHEGEVQAIAFAPDGRTLAAGGNRSVRLWDVQSSRQIRTLCRLCGNFHQVLFGPDGRTVVAASEAPNMLLVWRV
jgi:WD40 repeat protein